MNNLYLQIAGMMELLPGMVLATVVGVKGSTPQKPGSSALFSNGILISGTVGGGAVEGKVQEYAGKASITGESAILTFDLDNDVSMKEDAICGGTISVLIDANPLRHLSIFQAMNQSIADGIPGVLITIVKKRPFVEISRYWMTGSAETSLPDEIRNKVTSEVEGMIASPDNTGFTQVEFSLPVKEVSQLIFLESVSPLPRLVIAGAGHIGKAISHLGKMLGFEVTVIDDRREFANDFNLPDADHILVSDIGEAIVGIRKDADTYLVIVTRGHNDDATALKACINSDAGYIGMIGSRSKIAKMKDEFIVNKWTTEGQWQKIHAPIGLEIGSRSVEEIAVSIASQIVQVRRKANN